MSQLQPSEEWKPVMYCSKSLNETEQSYTQIEKENNYLDFRALSAVSAWSKFHDQKRSYASTSSIKKKR